MQAQYRLHLVSSRLVLWALAVALLVVVAAGGYAIRLATTSSAAAQPAAAAATHTTVSGPYSGGKDQCIFVQQHKAC